MWEKRATSAECKTIRIAESSVMDGWKGPRSRRTGKFYVFKRKVVSRWKQGGIKKVPGRYGFWEKMVGLGESTSRNPGKEKGASLSQCFEKVLQKCFQNVEMVSAISKRRRIISPNAFFNKDIEMLYSLCLKASFAKIKPYSHI